MGKITEMEWDDFTNFLGSTLSEMVGDTFWEEAKEEIKKSMSVSKIKAFIDTKNLSVKNPKQKYNIFYESFNNKIEIEEIEEDDWEYLGELRCFSKKIAEEVLKEFKYELDYIFRG